jgi:hypothetical protein
VDLGERFGIPLMMDRILNNWHTMRWFQLAASMMFLFAGLSRNDGVAFFASAFFGIQAIFNVGCFSTAGCAPRSKTISAGETPKDILYEEIT